MENKIVTAIFKDSTHTKVSDVWQYDYGQILRIQGLDLPTAVEVDFAVAGASESIARIGTTKDGVTDVVIPDSLIETGKNLVAYIYLRDAESGNTEYQIDMLVTKRAKPEAYDRPEDKELFGQAIEAVNTAADRAEKARQTAQEAAQKAGLDAEQTAQDRVEVAKMVETVTDISEQVKKVEELSNKAQESATQAGTSATAAEKAKAQAETAAGKTAEDRTAVNQAKIDVDEVQKAVRADRAAVEEAKQSVEQLSNAIPESTQVGVQAVNQAKQTAVYEIARTGISHKTAVEGAGTQAVENVENVKASATEAVETAKTEAVQSVQTEGTKQTGNVTTEGTKQVKAVQDKGNEVLQSIPGDFQTAMASKLDKQQGIENKGKALVIGEDGNVVAGEVQGGGSSVEVDSTLTQSGKAADAKVVGDNITTLQNEVEMSGILKYKKVDITGTFEYVNGYYGIKDGVLNTTSNKSTTKIPCKKGDRFVIEKADQQTLTCVLAIWDKNSKFIKGGNGYGSGKIKIESFPFEYTCEENDAFIAFGYAPLKVYKYIQSSFEEDLLQSVDRTMQTVTLEIYNTKKSESILGTLDIENKYLTQTGSFASYNDARGASIECKSGEIYYITGNGGNLSRVLGAVHNNGEFEVVLGVGTFKDYLYIVPEDVKELRYSTLNTDIFDIAKGEINESDSKIQKIETDLADLKANKGFAFKGKIGFAFGDSMTHGYSGGFIKYIESKTGAKITNYGHPGDGAKNMLGIITNGKYGSVNHNYNEPTLCDDYSNCSFVTIMIGTNGGINANWRDDFSKLPSLTYNQNMSHLPFEKDKVTISTADEYYKLFADNHTSYLAFAIEYLKYKNPNMFIFLVTPPPRKNDDMLEFREFLLTLGKRYGVPVIDAITNSGIDLSTYSDYSVDGTHFNAQGNIKWGNYIGHKINEYGQIYL
nr:MAG TPA: GDSL-like Lipase/Acylhydrolase [Caudoviricetes sp.]